MTASRQPLEVGVFTERLLHIIDEGAKVATYKLALLLALIDCCAMKSGEDGRAPSTLTTREIAERVVEIYWPQTRPYVSDGETVDLRQISARSSAVVTTVTRLRSAAEDLGLVSPGACRAALSTEYSRAVDDVEHTFARYPILLLQVVGGGDAPFIYDVDWDASITKRQLNACSGNLQLWPGAGDQLVRMAPLIRPLVELHWLRMVAALNRLDLEEERLRTHLFGSERTRFPQGLRAALLALQGDRCFYCQQSLGRERHVDHFLPWARWPNDAIENLVVADARCNLNKRHFLAGPRHLRRWAERSIRYGVALTDAAVGAGGLSARDRTVAIVRSTYAHLPDSAPLWDRIDTFVPSDRQQLGASMDGLR